MKRVEKSARQLDREHLDWQANRQLEIEKQMQAERDAGLCQGCYRNPCTCLSDNCPCDEE